MTRPNSKGEKILRRAMKHLRQRGKHNWGHMTSEQKRTLTELVNALMDKERAFTRAEDRVIEARTALANFINTLTDKE